MLALIQIEWWHYATFILGVLLVLALDLGVFHRKARVVKFREALAWTCLWVSLSLTFRLDSGTDAGSGRGSEISAWIYPGIVVVDGQRIRHRA
jgi:hypothetical protein